MKQIKWNVNFHICMSINICTFHIDLRNINNENCRLSVDKLHTAHICMYKHIFAFHTQTQTSVDNIHIHHICQVY